MKLLILLSIVGFAACAPQTGPNAVDLRPAFEQIKELIDIETIVDAINRTDLTTCENYTEIREYLEGPKFAAIHTHLWTDSEFLDVIKFISESGFPEIYDLFNQAFELLQLPYLVGPEGPLNPSARTYATRGTEVCNATALAQIISDAIPQKELISLVLELLNTEENVQTLFYKLSEPAKGESYKKTKNLPEVQDLIQAARDAGVEIDIILALLENILGYPPTKNAPNAVDLRPAFEQVKALIDVQSIVDAINKTDLTTCENYQKLKEYLAGPKFETIHNHLWTDVEFLDVIRFISESGFPEIYDLFNKAFELQNLPYRVGANGPINFRWVLSPQRGAEQCDEEALGKVISDAIPQNELIALVLELLNTEENVQALFYKLSEPAKGESYKKTKNLPEVQDLIQAARDAGVEIDIILALLENILGYMNKV